MITAPIGRMMPARDTAAPAAAAGSNSNSASSAITNAAGGAMGKDQFVQLLVSEMKNQDPMNPMDGKDLAAQLAQFSSVEQLMNINTKLDNFTTLFTASGAPTAAAGSPTTGSTTGSTTTQGA
ncbi:MAG TPA: flagellar hook capping FlgD N-terminal domain-containing protein [Gemmatimonadaceae bacterium]|jgi:flagellar basal-body rod modification protein FlgD